MSKPRRNGRPSNIIQWNADGTTRKQTTYSYYSPPKQMDPAETLMMIKHAEDSQR